MRKIIFLALNTSDIAFRNFPLAIDKKFILKLFLLLYFTQLPNLLTKGQTNANFCEVVSLITFFSLIIYFYRT